ncbi:MAG: hypothetical protein NTZ74_00905 [Chloroflexi bacterium]|nr:hypothetical protein [Chloroflexota bacterium]
MDKARLDLGLATPWMNSAGFMGFLPSPSPSVEIPFSAFVTNPISLLPRTPAHNRTLIPYPGGFLLHTGHPNPGLKIILRKFQEKWGRLPLPVLPHLLVQTPYECQQMVRLLEGVENISAIELGLPPGVSDPCLIGLVRAAMGELPVLVCIPLDQIESNLVDQLPVLAPAGIILTAPRGSVRTNGRHTNGRLYGPALFPQMCSALSGLKGIGLPIIAGCGIFSKEQGEDALELGASAVQIDAFCWKF